MLHFRKQFVKAQGAHFAKGLAIMMLPALAASCWASGVSTGYSGEAYGTAVKVTAGAGGITSGTTAATVLCTFASGVTNSNQVASVSVGGAVSTGAITTALTSETAGSTQSTVGTVTVANVNLLGGLISADALTAVGTASSSPSGYSTSAAGTTFGNLEILGIPVALNVSPNSVIKLPGIGEVILNAQKSTITANSAQFTVTLLDIRVNQNNTLGLPVGSRIEIGSATVGTTATVSLLSGMAYGASVYAPPLNSGAVAAITLPCGGTTGGEVLTNNTAGIVVPAILTAGATVETAQGTVTASSSTASTTATVASLNLLSGLVSATAIVADANGAISGSGSAFSDTGSSFGGITVTGHPEIGVNPAPNTEVQIAGVGTLFLHRVIQKSTSIEVKMIELVVTLSNTLGLPVGADITIADAKVGDILP